MSVSRVLYQSYLVFKLLMMDDDVVLKNMVSRVLPRLKLGGCHGADGGCHGDAEIYLNRLNKSVTKQGCKSRRCVRISVFMHIHDL